MGTKNFKEIDAKLILEKVVRELDRRFENNMKVVKQMTKGGKNSIVTIFAAAAKEDYDIIGFIDELCAEEFMNLYKKNK